MDNQKVFAMSFSKIYLLYIQKAERKNRTKEEVDEIICWLTGYDPESLQAQIDGNVSLQTFFEEAPQMNPNAALIKGVCLRRSCGGDRRSAYAEDTLAGQAH